MGHGKETPRQKMIGMMYLVLTALLALNVSKDVLDAFVLVDKGLTRTTENFASKNDMIYREFGKKFAENPVKVLPWKNKADEVKKQADELVSFIDTLKLEIVRTSEGRTPKSIVEGKIIGDLIGKKQDTNVPAQIMIKSDGSGKANDLKNSMESFRSYLLDLIPERDIVIRAAVETSLNTANPPPKGGATPTWQTENFQGIPLIGVLTLMSKMQADVRNAEADVIAYLYNQIDAGSLPFNKLEATVIPNTNYVFRGTDYEAQVFIAAYDTTQAPEIFIGRYQIVEKEDGSIDYEMVGDYQTLKAEPGSGVGIYKVRPTSIGPQKWGGLIRLRAPDGSFISRPFEEEYRVEEPSLVVSPTKMNVFYIGVDNPVEISVPGTSPDQLSVSSTRNAPIRRVSGTNFVVRPTTAGDATISVSANIDGTTRNMGSKPFRVRRLPDPVATVAGREGGNIDKNILMAQAVVLAELKNFDFDARFNVTSFTVSTTERGFTKDERSNSMRLTDAQKALIQNASRNQRIYIDDIMAVGPDGSERRLPTISFRIQ
jgi:gliding motility-associated protein GldM